VIDSSAFLTADFDAAASPDLARVSALVDSWASGYDVVAAPLGIGDHVDHQLVTEAARLLMEAGTAVAFYEDRPYAAGLDDDAVIAAAKSVDERLVRRPVSGPMGPGKHKRIVYPSQFDEYFLAAIASDEDGHKREHVWVLPDSPWPVPVPVPVPHA
jgi:hypothetical protein